jgi:hypothetical protein
MADFDFSFEPSRQEQSRDRQGADFTVALTFGLDVEGLLKHALMDELAPATNTHAGSRRGSYERSAP